MTQIIALIILIGSLAGILVILFRKIPILSELPETREGRTKWLVLIKEKFLIYNPLRGFSFIKFLQKILLGMERQTNVWLKKIKEKTKAEKSGLADGYWQQLKDTKVKIVERKKSKTKKLTKRIKRKSKTSK